MAAFVETGTYLDFAEKPWGKKRALLWPVLLHQVLYPAPRRAQLNLLQRAVLGLIRARTPHVEDMASLTGLHPDLIRLILAQGVSNGWLVDNADTLTDKGVALLDDEDVAEDNLKSGYVLQDALTGKFWPRLVVELSQVEPVDPLARYPEFRLDRKTGKTFRPFMLPAKNKALAAFDHDSLMQAYRDYAEDYQACQQLGHSPGLPEQVRLHGMQRLTEVVRYARVLVWVTADEQGQDLWVAKDPFALRENAWWLQEPLTQAIEQDAGLLTNLAPLVSIPRADKQSVDEWLETIRKQTEMRVLIEYPWVERQPDIKRHLAALLARQEKLQQGDASAQELDAALVESQKLLEVVMQWLIRTYPADVGQIPKQHRADFSLNRDILNALQLPAFTETVITLLSRQNLSQVIRACERPSSSLKALLFAAAMGTLSDPGHPLKSLGANELKLDELLELADLRNKSSHAQSSFTGNAPLQLNPSMARNSIKYALDFTSCFKEWM